MAKAIDPVCDMEVDTNNPRGGKSEYQGQTYYFCAPGCKVAFDRDPAKYFGPNKPKLNMGQPQPQKVSFIGKLFGKK